MQRLTRLWNNRNNKIFSNNNGYVLAVELVLASTDKAKSFDTLTSLIHHDSV